MIEYGNIELSMSFAKQFIRYFQSHTIDGIFAAHLNGKADHRKQIWTLYMFQKWWEKSITQGA